MSRCRYLMLLLLIAASTSPASAGPLGLFKKPKPPDPAERVPALIKTLQSDPDERKREQAAEDLRDFDTKAFDDIVPTLMEALKNDSGTGVRLACVNSLTRIRPVSPRMVYAMQQAAANDASLRVRLSADATLKQWRIIDGVQIGRRADIPSQTEEPPLASPPPATAMPAAPPPSMSVPFEAVNPPSTTMPMPAPAPTKSRLFPWLPAKNSKPPRDDGPILNPPN